MQSTIKRFSVNSILFSTLAALATIFVLGISHFIFSHDYKNFQVESRRLREDYLKTQQQMVKDEVEKTIEFIHYSWSKTESRLKTSIKERVDEAHAIATNLYAEHHMSKGKDEVRKIILDALRPIRFNNGRGYYFATRLDGVELLSANRPELEGISLLDMQDAQGAYVLRDMIKVIELEDEGFYQYRWTKPGVEGGDFPKIAYIKYFKPLNCLIGAGEYLDDVEQEIQREVLDRIEKIRFGQYGYIFVVNYNGVILMNGVQPELIGKDLWEMTDPYGVKVMQEERRAAEKPEGDFIQYHWEKPTTGQISPKISFVKGFPQWQWMVGAGVYADEVESVIAEKEAEGRRRMMASAVGLGLVLLVMLMASLVICFCLSRYFKRQLDLFLSFFQNMEKGGTPIATEHLFVSELHELGASANTMLEKRRRAEMQLRESEERFRSLFSNMAEGVALHELVPDERGQPINYRIVDVNPSYERILGIRREDIIGKLATEAYGTSEAPYLKEYGDAALSGITAHMETFFPPMGKHFEISVAPWGARGFATIFSDATARRKSEEALLESERELQRAQSIAHIGSYSWDIANDKSVWSEELKRILGCEDRAPSFDLIVSLLHPEDREHVLEKGKRAREEGIAFEAEYRIIRSDGETRWLHDRAEAESNSSGIPVRMFGTIQDITERKKDEQQREKLELQLRRSQRLETVGTLAGGIAHDFNNLLQVINGYTEMVIEELGPEQAVCASLVEVSKAGKRAARLVSQLLAFSRRQVLRPENLDMNEVIAHLLKMLGRLIGEHIRLDLVPGHRLGAVYADRGMMEQILINLCVNARDAMPNGGTLTIETENVAINGSYCEAHPWAKPGRYVLISVTDTGSGMDKETLERAFEPFFTTKAPGQGTGLGLATVYGIVQQHQGMIHAYSEPGSGTTFKVYLRIVERMASDVGPKIGHRAVGGTETILLAEDEEMVRDLASRILEKAGYRVLTAKDGEEAFVLFRENASQIDLLLLDVVMPKLGGRGVYEKARALKPDIPALFASGYTENAVHTNFVLKEGFRLIQKPFSGEDLLRAVREILDESQKESEKIMVEPW
jgi:PAS domain S-box-containing protein